MIVCDGLKVSECILRSEITEMELVSRFRCNGLNGYPARVDDLLEIRETAILIWTVLIMRSDSAMTRQMCRG